MSKKNTQIEALTQAYKEIKTLEGELQKKFLEVSRLTSQLLTMVELIDAQKILIVELHNRDLLRRFRKWYKLKLKV